LRFCGIDLQIQESLQQRALELNNPPAGLVQEAVASCPPTAVGAERSIKVE